MKSSVDEIQCVEKKRQQTVNFAQDKIISNKKDLTKKMRESAQTVHEGAKQVHVRRGKICRWETHIWISLKSTSLSHTDDPSMCRSAGNNDAQWDARTFLSIRVSPGPAPMPLTQASRLPSYLITYCACFFLFVVVSFDMIRSLTNLYLPYCQSVLLIVWLWL